MDKGRTQTNKSKDKKFDNDAQGITPERWHRQYVPRKEGRELASIEDCIVSSIQGLKENIKKSKERLKQSIISLVTELLTENNKN